MHPPCFSRSFRTFKGYNGVLGWYLGKRNEGYRVTKRVIPSERLLIMDKHFPFNGILIFTPSQHPLLFFFLFLYFFFLFHSFTHFSPFLGFSFSSFELFWVSTSFILFVWISTPYFLLFYHHSYLALGTTKVS